MLNPVCHSYVQPYNFSFWSVLIRALVSAITAATRSTMENSKSRSNSLLAIAVIVNILLTLVSVSCLLYKVHVLEDQIFHLQSNPQHKSSGTEDRARDIQQDDSTFSRSKRSEKSNKKSGTCASCHQACVKLFGLGVSSKVSSKPSNTGQEVVCLRGERGRPGVEGQRGRRGRPGYIGKPGKRGPPGPGGPQGQRGPTGKAFSGNTSKLIEKIDIPRIKTSHPASFTVREGSNFSLPCHAKGFPKPEITWYKNGDKLPVINYAETGTLAFPSIQFSDRGSYKCEARNFLAVDTASFRIVIEVLPRFVEKAPIYHTGYETWDTTLSCKIFGFPTPSIVWTRSFRVLPIDRHVVVGKELIIKGTRKEDRGPYMCRADNHLGHVLAIIVLVVDPVLPPVITVSPPPVIVVNELHKSVTLQCGARGSPAPTLEWSKDGEVLTANRTTRSAKEVSGELVISRFGASDQGVYKCFFRNYENGTAEILTTAKLVGCGDPGVPVHGYKIGSDFWAGKMVIFACDAGYHLEGPSNRLCLQNGNWSNVEPTCHRLCDEPSALDNGYRVGSEFWVGKNVTYECKKGYWLRGPTVRVCNKTGNWTGIGNWTWQEPSCEGHVFETSNILSNTSEYFELLKGWLEPVTGMPSKWKLCYRATDDGWAASTFHSQCNNVGPSVTFVKVKEYIFGGYTDRFWHSGGSYYDSAHSFIFSFKNLDGLPPFKLHVKKTDEAMYDNGGYGPAFGGYDFYIANYAGSNTNSYANLGDSYGQLAGYKYRATDTRNLLAGSYNFQPSEVEVFYQSHKD